MNVSNEVSEYFFEQIGGSYDGHMAAIPNNPVLSGLMIAHRVGTKKEFSEFLRQVANNLDPETAL